MSMDSAATRRRRCSKCSTPSKPPFQRPLLDPRLRLSRVSSCVPRTSVADPAPLQDRMEIITLPGTSKREALDRHPVPVPKQREANGLTDQTARSRRRDPRDLRYYTASRAAQLEADRVGVPQDRAPRREGGSKATLTKITPQKIKKLPAFRSTASARPRRPPRGRVHGPRLHRVGGELLQTEVSVTPARASSGHGRLGEVSRSRPRRALLRAHRAPRARAHARLLLEGRPAHPRARGRTPKDGPSPGSRSPRRSRPRSRAFRSAPRSR